METARLVAVPMVHALTLVANRSEHKVSLKLLLNGEMFTNIKVLLFPPREFCSKYVNCLCDDRKVSNEQS